MAASSLTSELKAAGGTSAVTKQVAILFASKMKDAGIKKIVFDHGGFGYRGKIKVFANTLREQGLEF